MLYLFGSVLTSTEMESEIPPINHNDLISGIKSEFYLKDIYSKVTETGKGSLTDAEIAFVRMQYDLYRNFNKALNLGDVLSKISKFLNITRQLPNTMAEVKTILSIGESIDKNEIGIDIPEFFKVLPHAESAYIGVELIRDTLQDNFYRYNEKITKIVNSVDKVIPIDYEGENENEKDQKKTDEFMKFLLNAVGWDPEYKGFQSEPHRVTKKGNLLTGENAFQDRFFKNVAVLKKSSLTKNNLFISAISEGRSNSGGKQLDFAAGANSDYIDIIDYENAFNELRNYEIVDGKVKKLSTLGNEDITLGFSMLQKDFLRNIVLSQGLIYSKNNYAEIIPLELAAIFMTKFERVMDSMLSEESELAAFTDLYKVQLAVANPTKLKNISSSRIVRDENSEYKKYVTDTDGLYADFSVSAKLNANGSINVSGTKNAYPEYVKSSYTDEATNKTTTRVYKRVDYHEEETEVHYQLVSLEKRSNVYSVGQSEEALNYDIDEAFRPDIRNIQVKNPKDGY